ncbi:MAG: hypothetical protein RL556_154, partial [Actinomycetota bacterium]
MNKKFAVLSIVLASTFGFASQAMAHDEVGATSPAANSVVEAGKFDVSVTFGEDILQTKGNPGEVIEVVGPKDAGAEVQSNGCVAVDAKVLSTPVDLDKPGTYTVNWRSVSSDGHATEGTYDFKLQNTTGYLSDGVPAESEACSAQAPEALATENT